MLRKRAQYPNNTHMYNINMRCNEYTGKNLFRWLDANSERYHLTDKEALQNVSLNLWEPYFSAMYAYVMLRTGRRRRVRIYAEGTLVGSSNGFSRRAIGIVRGGARGQGILLSFRQTGHLGQSKMHELSLSTSSSPCNIPVRWMRPIHVKCLHYIVMIFKQSKYMQCICITCTENYCSIHTQIMREHKNASSMDCNSSLFDTINCMYACNAHKVCALHEYIVWDNQVHAMSLRCICTLFDTT